MSVCFNSKVVRLKGEMGAGLLTEYESFNSKVVRLKGAHNGFDIKLLTVFQFQSGAVKRPVFQIITNRTKLFQFQSGAVKRIIAPQFKSIFTLFQFQSGAVKSSM